MKAAPRTVTAAPVSLLVTGAGASHAKQNRTNTMQANGIVGDPVSAAHWAKLAQAADELGFRPQSARKLSSTTGTHMGVVALAPCRIQLSLSDIHVHANAELERSEFTNYAGNGDGYGTESKHSSVLNPALHSAMQ